MYLDIWTYIYIYIHIYIYIYTFTYGPKFFRARNRDDTGKKNTFTGKKNHVPWKKYLQPLERSFGPLVVWSSGCLVLWSFGPVVLWSCGSLVLWFSGPVVLWSQKFYELRGNHVLGGSRCALPPNPPPARFRLNA